MSQPGTCAGCLQFTFVDSEGYCETCLCTFDRGEVVLCSGGCGRLLTPPRYTCLECEVDREIESEREVKHGQSE